MSKLSFPAKEIDAVIPEKKYSEALAAAVKEVENPFDDGAAALCRSRMRDLHDLDRMAEDMIAKWEIVRAYIAKAAADVPAPDYFVKEEPRATVAFTSTEKAWELVEGNGVKLPEFLAHAKITPKQAAELIGQDYKAFLANHGDIISKTLSEPKIKRSY